MFNVYGFPIFLFTLTTCYYYPHMPIGKVWIYLLLLFCLFVCFLFVRLFFVCLYDYGFLRRG